MCLSLMVQKNVNSIAVSVVTDNIVSTTIFWNNHFLTTADASQSLVLPEVLTKAKSILEITRINKNYLPPLLPLNCFSLPVLLL